MPALHSTFPRLNISKQSQSNRSGLQADDVVEQVLSQHFLNQ